MCVSMKPFESTLRFYKQIYTKFNFFSTKFQFVITKIYVRKFGVEKMYSDKFKRIGLQPIK